MTEKELLAKDAGLTIVGHTLGFKLPTMSLFSYICLMKYHGKHMAIKIVGENREASEES